MNLVEWDNEDDAVYDVKYQNGPLLSVVDRNVWLKPGGRPRTRGTPSQ
jgi:hypothetical protein